MCLYLLILLRISDRDYGRLFVFMFIPVLVNSSWKYHWINLDLVLGPRTLRCTFPIHQDKHLFCTECRGSVCSMISRCDECMQWTKEEMEKHVKLRKSHSSKSKRSRISSPPRSIPHDRDADVNVATQLDSVQKLVDDRIEAMSVQLMARFSSMLDKFQSRDSNISCSDSSAVLGHSATNTEPVSRCPTDRIKCPTGLRFRKGREDPVPQEDIITCDSVIDETPETPRYPPGDAGEPQGRRSAPAFVRHHQTGAEFELQPDDDDRDSGADSAPSIRHTCGS